MEKVDLNQSSKKELVKINKIGPVKAERIISFRKKNGPFKNIKELMQVKGFGGKIFSDIKSKLEVSKRVKIIFNPDEYDLVNEEINEVHLVGEMNDWNPADRSYSLSKTDNGSWVGWFYLEKGTEYKFMYNSESWEAGKHIGDGEENLTL